jgi:hypothetical protein
MPDLPQRKVGIVACSGEELPEGTVTRLAALKVLEDLRPARTVTICLPLFLAGGAGDRAFAKFYPTIAVDGCEKRCAARATELYSNAPAASILVDTVMAQHNLARPRGCRRLATESRVLVDAVAETIAAKVDHLMAVRWSRTEGAILEPAGEGPTVSTSACACGSGVPVTTVQIGGKSMQVMALQPILEMAYKQGLRADAALPEQIMATVRVYNTIAGEDAPAYAEAVNLAWSDYCRQKHGDAHG